MEKRFPDDPNLAHIPVSSEFTSCKIAGIRKLNYNLNNEDYKTAIHPDFSGFFLRKREFKTAKYYDP